MVLLKTMIIAVFMLFISMIIYSQVMPEINNVNKDIAGTDPTGTANATLNAANAIPDLKGEVKQTSGNFLLNLLENHPIWFFILVIMVAIILLYLGVKVYQVSGF